jgi:hypothetical protein
MPYREPASVDDILTIDNAARRVALDVITKQAKTEPVKV